MLVSFASRFGFEHAVNPVSIKTTSPIINIRFTQITSRQIIIKNYNTNQQYKQSCILYHCNLIFGGNNMSDLSATQCGGCGGFGGSSCSCLIIILLLLCCGGNNNGCGCGDNSGFDSCWIIILLILFCGCGSNSGCGCGNNGGCGCGC